MAGVGVKCPICGKTFNANKEDSVKSGRRYYHKECYETIATPKAEEVNEEEPKKKKVDMKVCFYCGLKFDILSEEYGKPRQNRYAHIKCFQENYIEDDKYVDEIYKYLKSLLINYDYQQCEKQRMGFIKKNGYTNEGMLLALKYFYDVKKQSPDRSGNRIGIIPYIYDEAQAYYEALEKKKEKINIDLKKQLDKKAIVVKVKGDEKRKNKGYIDFDKLGE